MVLQYRFGGVVVFAVDGKADCVTLLKDSAEFERLWFVVHSDLGPYFAGGSGINTKPSNRMGGVAEQCGRHVDNR